MSGGDGYLTNALYREIAKLMTDAGIPHRVELGAKHFHVVFMHLGVERRQILHLGPNNKRSTYRKTIIRFRKIVEAERAWRDEQTSPELSLEQPAMSEQEKPVAEAPSPTFDLALHVIEEEPRVLDTDLAAQLGIKAERQIRELIKRNLSEIAEHGGVVQHDTLVSGNKVKAFYLNEPQAVLISILSKTERAKQARSEVIRVFTAWRRGQLAPAVASIDTDAMKANAQLAASAAGGAAKNAVTPHIRHIDGRLDQINARIDDMARWLNGWRKDAVGYDEAILDRVGRPYVATEFVTMHEIKALVGVEHHTCGRSLTNCLHHAAIKFFSKPNRGFYSDDRTGRDVYWFAKPFVFEFWHQVGKAIYERHLRRPAQNLLPFKKPGEGEV